MPSSGFIAKGERRRESAVVAVSRRGTALSLRGGRSGAVDTTGVGVAAGGGHGADGDGVCWPQGEGEVSSLLPSEPREK